MSRRAHHVKGLSAAEAEASARAAELMRNEDIFYRHLITPLPAGRWGRTAAKSPATVKIDAGRG